MGFDLDDHRDRQRPAKADIKPMLGVAPVAPPGSPTSPRQKKETRTPGRLLITVAGLCLGATLAHAAPRAPRTLLVDACGQMRDNALRIWPEQKIVSIRESRDGKIIYCFVGDADHNMLATFGVKPQARSDPSDAGREALKAACNQMQGDPKNVFEGRKVYFTEDPDIKVVYCLVRKPDATDTPDVGPTDPHFVDTVEMLFMSSYGEPLGQNM